MAGAKEYYVYFYLRDDGTPYYIGKGSKNRAFVKGKGQIKPPKDKSKILVRHNNLTEMGSFILERYYIKWFGRKDNGTGILRNRTDGGDGCSGYRHNENSKNKMRIAKLGKSPYNKGIKRPGIGGVKKGNVPWNTNGIKSWIITTPSNETLEINNLSEFCRNNGLSDGAMVKIAKGLRKIHKGYKCYYKEDYLNVGK